MESVNSEILELWGNAPIGSHNNLMPAFYPSLKTGTLLFVGINPSFSARGFNSVLKGTEYSGLDVGTFYKYPKSKSFDLAVALEIERLAIKRHAYFKKFKKVSDVVGLDWEHVDLFFIRETNQKNLVRSVFDTGRELSPFGAEQIRLSTKLVEFVQPKGVVVANALASELFKSSFKAEFDSKHGCHFAEINNKRTPVFLTSMLTGQRALDNFTFDRLCWHIEKVIGETKN